MDLNKLKKVWSLNEVVPLRDFMGIPNAAYVFTMTGSPGSEFTTTAASEDDAWAAFLWCLQNTYESR